MKLLLVAVFLISFSSADLCAESCHSDGCLGTGDNGVPAGEQWITTQKSSSIMGCCWMYMGACDLCCPPAPPLPPQESQAQQETISQMHVTFASATTDEVMRYEGALKEALASALGIDVGKIDMNLEQQGEAVMIIYTMQGDYVKQLNDPELSHTYFSGLQRIDEAAYALAVRQPETKVSESHVRITFHNTNTEMCQAHIGSLEATMAKTLGVDVGSVKATLETHGTDVVVVYVILGEHSATVESSDFAAMYYDSLKKTAPDMFAVSQGTHSSQKTEVEIHFENTKSSVLQKHIASLKKSVEMVLQIDGGVDVELKEVGKDCIAAFTIKGDYNKAVMDSEFPHAFIITLQGIDLEAYKLSQGSHTSQNPCENAKCKNGGICQPAENKRGYKCNCARTYKGNNCQQSSIPTCDLDAYYPTKKECRCQRNACSEGAFCHAGGCTSSAPCDVRDSIDSEFFYGAKLEGRWDHETRDMYLDLPIPGDVMVSKIDWIDAQSPILGYGANVKSMWTKDTTNQCRTHYKLKINCDDFFGKGSRFTLTGKQMKTELRVDASEKVVQTIDGFSYTRKREMSNIVPLLVNLIERTTVRAHFRTVYSTQRNLELKVPYISISVEEISKFKTETNDMLKQFGDVSVVNIGSKTTGETSSQGNMEIELTGVPGDVQRAISYLKIHGFKIADFGPYEVERKVEKHHEFVIFISARQVNDKTIEIEMEVHTRTGIDHSKEDGGCHVTTVGKEKIDESKGITFDWGMDEDGKNYKVTTEHDLKVETVKWTFSPKRTSEGSYEIPLEFSLNGDLGSFVSFASVNVKSADVLGDIGFGANAVLYSDMDATIASSSFKLGQTFYAKITLDKVCVDVASVTCEKMTLVQTTEEGEKVSTNMKDKAYEPVEKDAGLNAVMCGATLSGDRFHARADGYHTDLEIVVKVNYKQGKQADMLTLRRRLSFENEERHADDSEVIDLEMEILPESVETAIGYMQNLVGQTGFNKGSLIALTLLSSGAFLLYNYIHGKKFSEYHPLIEV